jgi:citrate lyase subunit beta / citryl-CoA lyase
VTPLPPMRSMLSVPGSSERFLTRARTIPADAFSFDLEDGVAAADKEAARRLVAATLPDFPAGHRQVWVRPNALDSGLLEADLDTVVGPGLTGLHLPKVAEPETLRQVDHYLTFLERTRGLPAGAVRLGAWIESAAGVQRIDEICAASPRLALVALGPEDYAASMGVPRTRESAELAYPRARIANAASAAGLAAMDGPEIDYRDRELYLAQARVARGVGFGARFCIHPDQVALANEVFAPTTGETAWALRVAEAFEAAGEGAGAIAVDGEMIDRPVYLRALKLLGR